MMQLVLLVVLALAPLTHPFHLPASSPPPAPDPWPHPSSPPPPQAWILQAAAKRGKTDWRDLDLNPQVSSGANPTHPAPRNT
jgi:hypothetical protein